jgi:hypothetical protein
VESARGRGYRFIPLNGPSWIDLAAIRVNTTESRFMACLNRLLQQNRHFSDVSRARDIVRC